MSISTISLLLFAPPHQFCPLRKKLSSPQPLHRTNFIPPLWPRRLKHAPLAKRQSQPFMHLHLKRRKRSGFSINADDAVGIFVAGRQPESGHFLVRDKRVVKEVAVFDRELHLDVLPQGNVAVGGDQIEQAVVGEGGGEEVGVWGHVCHLFPGTGLLVKRRKR